MLSSLPGPAAGGSGCMPQDPAPFLTGIWLDKPFLLEKLSAVNGFFLLLFNRKDAGLG